MSGLVTLDPFEGALQEISSKLPAEFAFEIDCHYLEHISMADYALAQRRAETMRYFEAKCSELGYTIEHHRNAASQCWLYHLRRGKDAPNNLGPKPAPELPALPPAAPKPFEVHKLDTQEQVFFYEQDFYVLSNFSAFTLMWKGIRFDTSEAAYHWEKFPDEYAIRNRIQVAPSAHEAFKIAERHRSERRKDWDDVKVGIMLEILMQKALQHEYVRVKLEATGNRELVEDSWRDPFWGWGEDTKGQNMLGKLWMEVRTRLRAEHKMTHGR